MLPSMRRLDSEHARVLNRCFCVLTIGFDRSVISPILKQVIKLWSEGQKADGAYTRKVWTDETEPRSVFIGLDRWCVRGPRLQVQSSERHFVKFPLASPVTLSSDIKQCAED